MTRAQNLVNAFFFLFFFFFFYYYYYFYEGFRSVSVYFIKHNLFCLNEKKGRGGGVVVRGPSLQTAETFFSPRVEIISRRFLRLSQGLWGTEE